MEAILTTFGIDWRLLLINGVNFGLLLLGLWYFFYTPMLKMLETRRQKVAQGVRDAEKSGEELKEIQASKSETLAQAGKEADSILSRAQAAGVKKEHELVAHGEAAAASALLDAQRQAEELKVQAITESKEEVAKLIVLGVEKMLVQK